MPDITLDIMKVTFLCLLFFIVNIFYFLILSLLPSSSTPSVSTSPYRVVYFPGTQSTQRPRFLIVSP